MFLCNKNLFLVLKEHISLRDHIGEVAPCKNKDFYGLFCVNVSIISIQKAFICFEILVLYLRKEGIMPRICIGVVGPKYLDLFL